MHPKSVVVCAALAGALVGCGTRTDLAIPDADVVDVVDAAPAPVSTRRLAAGREHTCTILDDATVECWGYNAFGQLGDGTTTDRSTPTKVVGLDSVAEIEAGDSHTCARRTDGRVFCWGSDADGELGIGEAGARVSIDQPVELTWAASSFAQLSLGMDHTCALRTDGAVSCWGTNPVGQVGDGTTIGPRYSPNVVAGLSAVVQVAGANQCTCAVVADGTVKCWGALPVLPGDSLAPTTVPGLAQAREIAICTMFTGPLCARLSDGTVDCWNGTSLQVVAGLRDVAGIAAGGRHTCARLTDGTAACWGSNDAGQLGDGTSGGARDTPAPVPGLANVEELALGGSHSCARLSDGSVWCWGWNQSGQIGDGTKTDRSVPVRVK